MHAQFILHHIFMVMSVAVLCNVLFSSFNSHVNDEKENLLPKLQIFNEFNARKPDEFNIFKGVTRNYLFMGIVGLTVVLQVSLV